MGFKEAFLYRKFMIFYVRKLSYIKYKEPYLFVFKFKKYTKITYILLKYYFNIQKYSIFIKML